jgi:hypothetical protein
LPFVERKEKFNALAVAVEGLRPVAKVNRPVQLGMGSGQGSWYRYRIVEVSQR